MVQEDQAVRRYTDTIAIKYGKESTQMDSLGKAMNHIDSLHNTILKEVIDELKSYPDISLVGPRGAKNFWVLVQHQDADTTFQKEVLQLMKYALDYKQVSPRDFAYLVDRVRVNTGQKQIYGTQFQDNEDGTALIPKPIEDSLNVEIRRAEMDLPPLATYLEYGNERFKYRLNKRADTVNTR